VADQLTGTPEDRPIRVVYFGGTFLENSALRFLSALITHPEVEFVGGVCQSAGFGLWARVRETVRRRGAMAPISLAVHLIEAAVATLRTPRRTLAVRRNARRAVDRIILVPDVHGPEVLERVRAMNADLGVIYGSPVLRPELFSIPRFGTLGIHHGTLPRYRGKKTTFWEVFNGEPTAGVTIQRVNAGLDTGEVVMQGDVPIGIRSVWAVERDLHELGVCLYMDAILAIHRGTAVAVQQRSVGRTPSYHDPRPLDILRLAGRRIVRALGGHPPPRAPGGKSR
jgi:folate-dependent phosphoribosylglycinamide formyltransferase PurN